MDVINDNCCVIEKLSCEKSVFNFPFSFYLWLSVDKNPTLEHRILYNGIHHGDCIFLSCLVNFSYTNSVLSLEWKKDSLFSELQFWGNEDRGNICLLLFVYLAFY